MRTYRFRAHSMYDPELYRSKEEVEEWKKHGPLASLEGRMKAAGMIDDVAIEAMDAEVAAEVDGAVAFAEAGTLEPVEDLERFVYSEEGGR